MTKLTQSKLNSDNVDSIFMQVKQNLGSLFDKCNQDFVQHKFELEQVFLLLGDQSSRKAYLQELAFLTVRNFYPDLAYMFSPLSKKCWSEQVEICKKLVQEKHIPYLKTHDEDDDDFLYKILTENFVLQSYRYKDLVKVEPGEVFIDCGAFIGDTTIWAYKNQAAKVYSFEPCPTSWPILKSNLANNGLPVEFYPFATSKTNGKLYFMYTDSGPASAKIISAEEFNAIKQLKQSEAGSKIEIIEVDCIKLDDWFEQNQITPTYIKMDIEGAELHSLMGGAKTIKRLKPKLAICLYHRNSDMWNIPLYLHSLVPEYKFYCKKNHHHWEFILYATV